MEKILKLTFCIIFISFLTNCRKGEGDPVLSLKSRKARLIGVWNIDSFVKDFNTGTSINSLFSYTSQGVTVSGQETYSSSDIGSEALNNKMITINSNENTSQNSQFNTSNEISITTKNGTGSAVATIEFNKDGTFSRTIDYSDIKFSINSQMISSGFTTTEIINSVERKLEKTSGTWEFLGKISNEYKNKERILLKLGSTIIENSYTDNKGLTTSKTENFTYSTADNSEIWTLGTLSKDKLEYLADYNLQSNYSESNFSSTQNSSQSETTNGSKISSGKVTASLSK
jgi:hypothetical protein